LKIILLSDANSVHTIKWVKSLSQQGLEVQLFSLFEPNKELSKSYAKYNVKVNSANLKPKIKELREPNISKLKYILSFPIIKKMIKNFKPDLIHAHYASSYGFLALLTGFRPFIVSVWGSDIYYFPEKNKINKYLINLLIKNSDTVCSTSFAMKQIIEKEYGRSDVDVIPFGIDLDSFFPIVKKKKKFTVGTIKSIENHNGIDCLIDAASIVINNYKKDINFLIVGEGSLKNKMKKKAVDLKVDKKLKFVGFVDHKNVLKYYNDLSLFIAVSTRESFGVSILEAAACEIPSITSNVGGLTEVNVNKITGIVIEPNNPQKLAKSIINLYENEKLRLKLGKGARKRVVEKYNWNSCVDNMINIYKKYDN
tara:strand:+ start:4545 stop:5645 length:1101 start_codon:yes stop_codon:yes gene_type:complete